jgi:hypothetical protein
MTAETGSPRASKVLKHSAVLQGTAASLRAVREVGEEALAAAGRIAEAKTADKKAHARAGTEVAAALYRGCEESEMINPSEGKFTHAHLVLLLLIVMWFTGLAIYWAASLEPAL